MNISFFLFFNDKISFKSKKLIENIILRPRLMKLFKKFLNNKKKLLNKLAFTRAF